MWFLPNKLRSKRKILQQKRVVMITYLVWFLLSGLFPLITQAQPITWEEPVNLTNFSALQYRAQMPAIWVNAVGQNFVVFTQNYQSGIRDLYFTWYDGSRWQSPVCIFDSSYFNVYNPHILGAGHNRLHVIFEPYYGDFGRILYLQKDSTGWQAPVQLSVDSLGPALQSDMVQDSLGNIHVFWGGHDIYHRVLHGSMWSNPEAVTTLPRNSSASFPSAVVAQDNTVHLTYVVYGPAYENIQVYYQHQSPNEWSPPVNVSRNDSLWGINPDINVDNEGRPMIAWAQYLQGNQREIYWSHQIGNSWTPPEAITHSHTDANFPIILNYQNTPLVFYNAYNPNLTFYYSFLENEIWEIYQLRTNSLMFAYSKIFFQPPNTLNLIFSSTDWAPQESDIFYMQGTTAPNKVDTPSSLPHTFHLGSPYPNPFNHVVTFPFWVNTKIRLTATIVDVRGRMILTLVKNNPYAQGQYRWQWSGINTDGKEVANGMYFLVIRSNSQIIATAKILVLK